ncbi:MAG: hypothetical protein C0504_11710 [Candidatus Solibacter sp.]|nr:hypothetical protein [Candidatus Solibacter sp.]
MERATRIIDIAQALSPQPLTDSGEFARFYGERFESREADTTAIMALELRQRHGGVFYQQFLTGHSGTGKSTELTRLSRELSDRFEFLRLSAQSELSPFSTKPFDLLEVMAILLVERANELGLSLDGKLLQQLSDWFSEVTETRVTERTLSAESVAAAGASLPSIIQSFLSLSVKVKGEAKYSGSRSDEAVRKRLQRLPELTSLCNELFRHCNEALVKSTGKEWVFLVEDLDKKSVAEQVLNQLFVQYSNIWRDLRVHFICTVPLWLTFGETGALLPFRPRTLVDIPVFDATHQPNHTGRRVLREILDKRVDTALFGEGVEEHLIQAAGGNLRDMFHLVSEAANFAAVTGQPLIQMEHAKRAVNGLRNEYLRRLGETVQENVIPYSEKVTKLTDIYEGGDSRLVQDHVLYRLLRSRVVLEYNDTYWYGLPPLVVDILIQQGHLPGNSKGGLESPV